MSISQVHCGCTDGGLKELLKMVTRCGISGMAKLNALQMGRVDWELVVGIADAILPILDFLFFSPMAKDALVRAEDAFEWLGRQYDSLEFCPSGNCCQIQYIKELKEALHPYYIIHKIYETNFDFLILQHVVSNQFSLHKFLEKLCHQKAMIKVVKWWILLLVLMSIEADTWPSTASFRHIFEELLLNVNGNIPSQRTCISMLRTESLLDAPQQHIKCFLSFLLWIEYLSHSGSHKLETHEINYKAIDGGFWNK